MRPLAEFPLPLPPNQPPAGFGLEERDFSELSTTSAFNNAINQRDKFLGKKRCVICGWSLDLEPCLIIAQADYDTWADLRNRGWIPSQAKHEPMHEPRNALLLCPSHHTAFNRCRFFIRFLPEAQKFVFINYSRNPDFDYQGSHGKAIALDIKDRHVPFTSLFIIHELRVRGFYPFQAIPPAIPDEIAWQDWISTDGLYDDVTGSFKRRKPPSNDITVQPQLPLLPVTTDTDGTSSGIRTLPLNANVITDILAATRASPSWKACQMEGTSWTGTAEENVQKYLSTIGV